MKTKFTIILTITAMLLLALPSWGQVSTSSITGQVTDSTGAVMAGVKVQAKNEATGVVYDSTTNSSGNYNFPSIPPGSYAITVSQQGFQTFLATHNVLSVGQPLVVDVALKVGAQSETVQVEGSYERIETANAQVSDVVTQQEVKQLPLNGRNPLTLITLEPGLVQRTSGGATSGSGTHVFGGRNGANNVTIDGIEANESTNPDPQSNLYRLNPDNVAEFRVVTHNATPEYGRNSGAQVAIATKSGTNNVHGDVFYFNRNDAYNANEYFNKYDQLKAGKANVPPTLRLHQWGVDVGGPIVKDRTFWFFSYQSNHIRLTQPISVAFGGLPIVYTPSMRQGIFRYFIPDPSNPLVINGKTINGNSPALVDPNTGQLLSQVKQCTASGQKGCVASFNIGAGDPQKIGLDPTIGKLIATFPGANSYNVGDGLNTAGYNWNPPSGFEGPNYMGRIDHKFSDRDNLFGRFIWSHYNTVLGDFLNVRPAIFPGFPPQGTNQRLGQNLAISYRHVFSANIVNELTAGYSRFGFTFPMSENFTGSSYPTWVQGCGFGSNTFSSINTPFCNNPQTHRAVSTVQYIDNLSILKGSHNIKTGINFRLYAHNDARGGPGGGNITPTLVFDQTVVNSGITSPAGIASTDSNLFQQSAVELLGIPARGVVWYPALLGADKYSDDLQRLHTRVRQFDFYGQDEWQIKRNLTMTYGLRWEYNPPATDAEGASFIPRPFVDGSGGNVTFTKNDTWWERKNWNTFAPRVGVAWSPRGSDKMVVRAGYGIAFDTVNTFMVTAVAGKVPGAVLQLRPVVSGRIPSVVSQLETLLAVPSAKPSTQFSPGPAAFGTAPDTGAFDPKLQQPTVHEWSLTVQRELPWKFVFQAGYIGKHGTHLYRAYDLNQINTNQSGFLDSFLIAQRNIKLGCNADGSGCPTGVTSAGIPTLIERLAGCTGSTCSTINSSTYKTNFQQNGLGEIARRLDTNFKMATGGYPLNYFRPNPQFGSIFFIDAEGNSNYNGGIFQVRRRFEQGLEFGAAYTYSKSIDDMSLDPVGASTGGGLSSTNSRTPTDIHNFALDRARSDFDNTHVLLAHMVYELPFGQGRRFASAAPRWLNEIVGGWSLTNIFNFQSGEPFTVNSGVRTANGYKVTRAAIVGAQPSSALHFVNGIEGPVVFNASVGLDANNCKQIINTQSQFCIPAPGQYGSGRNAFQGPGFWNLDSGIGKNFNITERVKFQFRAEFFNVLNHVNFDNPRNATVGSPTLTSSVFGETCCTASSLKSAATVIATGESNRVIQFGAKINF